MEIFGISLFTWGALATTLGVLVFAMVFTNLDVIEAEIEEIESKCKGPCS